MKYGTWTISSYEESAAGALRAAGWSPVTAAVLCSRGYDTPEKAQEFLSADVPLSSPMDLLDMDKAVYSGCYTFEEGGIEAFTSQSGPEARQKQEG